MRAFFALDDMREENGRPIFCPTRNGDGGPSEEECMAHAERALRAAGSLIMINPRVWHRGSNNFTDKPRQALTIGACRSYMRTRFDFPRLIENIASDVLDNWDERAASPWLHVRVPASMEEH
jgi:ectoine hydroxylase-related dioxygenase (phytanoyl-CoA dioxygenase family)